MLWLRYTALTFKFQRAVTRFVFIINPFTFINATREGKKREITAPLVQRSSMYIGVNTCGKNVGTLGEERAAATDTWSVVKYIYSQLAISKREGMMLSWWVHLRASLCCIFYWSHWLVRKTIQIMIIIAFTSDRKKIRTWDQISRKSGVIMVGCDLYDGHNL